MEEFVKKIIALPFFWPAFKAVVTILLLFIVYHFIRAPLKQAASKQFSQNTVSMIDLVCRYVFLALAVMYILGVFGINLNALLGAAGVAGIAVGFAAQTSISNIISGFFLFGEKMVKIGDCITAGETSGTVDSITLLAVRIKTPDGRMVRVPNEAIIKSHMVNSSFFTVRRLSVNVKVASGSDLESALAALKAVPAAIPLILTDPAPLVLVDSFTDSGISLNLFVWCNSSDLVTVHNALFVSVTSVFDTSRIEIPFPQFDVHVR